MEVFFALDDSDALDPFPKPVGTGVFESLEEAKAACEHELRYLKHKPTWTESIQGMQWRYGFTSVYVERLELGHATQAVGGVLRLEG